MTCSCESLWLIQTDLELRCGPILTTQMDGNPPSLQLIITPFLQVQVARLVTYIAWTLMLVAQIIKCRQGCAGSCPSSAVEHGYQAGKETATCRICGTNFPHYNVILSDLLPEIGEGDLPREQSANEEDSNDTSAPVRPASRIPPRPRSSVFCLRNKSSFRCVRTPCCFFWFWWSKSASRCHWLFC